MAVREAHTRHSAARRLLVVDELHQEGVVRPRALEHGLEGAGGNGAEAGAVAVLKGRVVKAL